MARSFPPAVEQWRPLVSQYFRPGDVDKALWVIQHESSGNRYALGDRGASGGLFQLNARGLGAGMSNDQKFDPETNIRKAASAVYGGSGWSPWGEGTSHLPPYNEATGTGRFGALGNHPFPGSAGSSSMPITYDPSVPPGGTPGSGAVLPTPPAAGTPQSALPSPGMPRIHRDPATGAVLIGTDLYGDGEITWDFAGFDRDPSTGETPEERMFFHQNPSAAQQAQIAIQKAQLAETQANNRARILLEQGQLDLAREAQDEAKYWHEIQAGLQRDQTAVTARGQDMDFTTRMAEVQQAREASDKNFQVGMANATNEAQRNEITARWNQEQAAIAKMEDETRRILGGQQNQTAQFGAETNRAVGMGNLALDTNKFLLEASTSPRDLFGLYFLQRGITPDWDTMAAGGTPAQGQPIVPVNPMSAYVPTTAPPTFNGTPQNSSAAGVGAATAAGVTASQQRNPFIGPAQTSPAPAVAPPAPFVQGATPPRAPQAPRGSGGPQGPGVPTYPPSSTYPAPTVNAPVRNNPGGGIDFLNAPNAGTTTPPHAGFPNTDVPAWARTQGAGWLQADIDAYNRSRSTYESLMGQGQAEVAQQFKAMMDQAVQQRGGPPPPRLNEGGMVNDPVMMVGDAPLNMPPDAGGARPEMIVNPTQAPIGIIPAHAMGYGVRRFALGSGYVGQPAAYSAGRHMYGYNVYKPEPQEAGALPIGQSEVSQSNLSAPATAKGNTPSWGSTGPAPAPPPMPAAAPPPMGTMPVQPAPRPVVTMPMQPSGGGGGGEIATAPRQPVPNEDPRSWGGPRQPVSNEDPRSWGGRTAPGAQWDPIKAQYLGTGMGQLWQNSSNNPHLAGSQVPLPTRLQMLANYGVPLPPSLVASVTGQIAPPLNMAGAWTSGRQAGVMPSLQTLNRQSPGESELFRGYAEGVAGVPWADLISYLQQGTAGLNKAQRARAA